MRLAICDDDKLISEEIQKYLQEFFKKRKLPDPEFVIFDCGEDLLSDKKTKDIIFLDIEMPGFDGIHVGNEIKKQNKDAIIFIVTSFMEYLDDAMRFHVFRYLSKPLDKQRLFSNMQDALKLYTSLSETIPIETKQGIVSANMNDIIMIESQGRTVLVHTTDGDYTSLYNLNYWEQKLPKQCFFQSHRSYIVNFAHINEFDHANIFLYNRQFMAFLTRRKYATFKDAYLLYLESTR